MSTKKLQIVTPIVTSVNGETGDVTLNSIEYTHQSLTDAQKTQARENIGALDKYNGMMPVECSYTDIITQKPTVTTLYVSQGTLIPPSDDASEELKTAWNFMFLVPFGGSYTEAPKNARNDVKNIALLAENGVFGLDFLSNTGNTFECANNVIGDADKMRVTVSSVSSKLIIVNFYSRYGISQQMTYSIVNGTFSDYAKFLAPLQKSANNSSADKLTLYQVEMSAAPTTDMQIATKKYVDDGIAGKADSSHNHSASNITSGTLPITRGGTNASTAAAARTNLGFSYGTSVPTSAPVTGNGAVFFCQDSGSPLSIANGGTGGATQDAARTNLGLPTQDKRVVNICNGTRLVTGSNITITLDPTEAKKYSAVLILLGTPLGGNYGNMYDSFVFPLNPDTWSFRFFKYTLEGQDWQCAKANLSSDWTTFTITAVSGATNHPCWCYLM